MKFYIYHKPIYSIRKNEWTGTLIRVTTSEEEITDDTWSVRRCVRSESVYNRLVRMLNNGGVDQDGFHPLAERKLSDLITYMDQWSVK